MTNDANAFALAEASFGAGLGAGIVLGVTLGTGCGCGIVVEGRLLEGATANAGELYRAPLLGANFDAMLSGRGLQRHYEQVTGGAVPGAEVTRRASTGEGAALRALAAFGADVGAGLGVLVATLDPDIVVLGGSVTEACPTLRRRCAPPSTTASPPWWRRSSASCRRSLETSPAPSAPRHSFEAVNFCPARP